MNPAISLPTKLVSDFGNLVSGLSGLIPAGGEGLLERVD